MNFASNQIRELQHTISGYFTIFLYTCAHFVSNSISLHAHCPWALMGIVSFIPGFPFNLIFFNWLLSFLKRKWILICWQKANTRNTSYIWKQYEQANSIASMFTGPRQSKGRQPKYRLLKQLFYTAMHLHQLPNHYHRFNIFVIRITDNKTKAENFPFTNKTRFLRTKMKAQERIIWARRILVNKWK